jgi:hypothetical protein
MGHAKAGRAAAHHHQQALRGAFMKIRYLKQDSSQGNWDGWHLLTVAESGFSVLDHFARELALDGATIHQFADRINATNESGSLHPRAPISAIPCRYLRELAEPENESMMNEFKHHIAEFIEANSKTIHASRILVDLHVSSDPVPAHFVEATTDVFSNFNPGEVLEEVVIAV